jgi:PEP-CTERM motif-containing protein
MRRLELAVLTIAGLIAAVPQARADIALQDFGVNINGTAYDYNNLGQTDPTTLPGMNASGFSTFTSGDGLGTGLGTLQYTFNGAPGSYFVNFYFDESVSVPFYNEFGSVNGSTPAGMSYEIAQVNPSVGGIQFCSWNGVSCAPNAQILPNSLDNTNHAPGGNTNFLGNCVTAPCNADVATALGFTFTLGAGEQAVIDVTQSTSNPGGFYLEQVHPIDSNNRSATDVFLSGDITIGPAGGPPPPSVPEPGSLILLGTAFSIVAYAGRRKLARS